MTSPVSAIEAIEKAMEGVKKQADRHYCNALSQFEKTPCLGAEFKMKEGLFGRIEHEAHASANKAMGHHFGMYEAIRQLEPLMREVLALARQAEALQRENAEKDARIAALEGALDESKSMHLSALRRDVVSRDALQKVVNAVLKWAEQRCPCENEQPNPCPLCGASVENLEPCKSAENIIPRHLLADLRRARALLGGENAE